MQVSDEENAESGQQSATTAAAVGIGKKMYYSISEVCAMTGIGQHVLRYWEKEFALLHPKKNSGGKRAYKEKDIEAIVKIKRMLDEEKYTLQGAKEKLLDERRERRTGAGSGNAIVTVAVTATKTAKKKSVPKNSSVRRINNGSVNNDSSNDKDNDRGDDSNNDYDGDNNKQRSNDHALILGIRDELLGVLGVLERD